MQTAKSYRLGIAALVTSVLSTFSGCPSAAKGDLALSGTVYHATTKEPFNGALVLGIYKQCRSGFAATACFCVRTAATRTGPDGTFKFPVTKTEGAPRLAIFAANHFLKEAERPSPEAQQKRDKSSYIGWDLWLAPQDPENPDFHYESETDLPCKEPASKEAAQAGLEFGEATDAERARLLQVVVDNARQKPLTPAKKIEIGRMERDIDVLQLGEVAAREKQQKISEFRSMSKVCSLASQFPPKQLCCFGFTDKSRAPLMAEALKKEQIKHTLNDGSVCVLRQEDNERAGALQLTIP